MAAQHKEPGPDEFKRLNARIKWQLDNQLRGLRYVPLKIEELKLYAFVDGSFANNKDLSSQLGYVIAIGNEKRYDNSKFSLNGTIIT